MHSFALLVVALILSVVVLAVDNVTEPISTFISRPDLQVPALNVSIQNSDPVDGFAPGYLFICPYQSTQHGPYIYDKFGHLVWTGYNASLGNNNTMDMKLCTFQGSDHLCMWQGKQKQGYGLGQGVVLNNNYQPVAYVNTGDGESADIHEFNMINGGDSALFTAYRWFPYDLSAFPITANPSWLMEGVFQEINVTTGEVIFDWHSTVHVNPSGSYVAPASSDVSGNGTAVAPWDYFHINSVDKSSVTNNYLISSRHMSAIYCIDSSDGSIVWQLSCGGVNASFVVEGFNFSFQHDARFVLENDTHTIISIFDNASNGFNGSATESSGMVISIDLNAKIATLLSRTVAPIPGGILSDSQGNTQILSNGAVFHGWGSVAAISETNSKGEAVLFASYGAYPVMNYRAYSYPWNGFPLDKPALVAPAQTQNYSTPIVAYVSWNGATEVKSWRFWGSTSNAGPFSNMGMVNKAGFETTFTSPVYNPFIFVEAVGFNGESWANSSTITVSQIDTNGNGIVSTSTPLPLSVSSSMPAGMTSSVSFNSTTVSMVVANLTTISSMATFAISSAASSAAASASATSSPSAAEMHDVGLAKTLALCVAALAIFVTI
ncbi:hypothetical protein K432DRAFT_421785 [Lepidopterella palustris CBS 459.81]|uniref:Arylsulfotransferase n=1 Tax=Lepidopterella palustris CBS 459.81 TaxID=1314670 RepID=A0A8E2JJX3_9PEZI|nr:hypothetical protein K432DRAFT_421785 [Lepidopterella palustris CBS 459.81]